MRRPPAADERFARRSRRHIWLGGLVGGLAGALIGWGIGAAVFDGGRGLWASIVAGMIFVGGIATFVAGLSSLEPPRPGRELASTDPEATPDPKRGDPDAPPLVVEERLPERDDGGEGGPPTTPPGASR